MSSVLPAELSAFMAGDEDAERSLLALAAAESLTDPLAHDLLRVALGSEVDPEPLVSALHLCDFVVERNSEWHLALEVREALVERLTNSPDLSDLLHTRLLELADPNAEGETPQELPRYLTGGVGRAYHKTFLSPSGLRGYAQIAHQPLSGQQWLAGMLASEQVRLGVIPEDTIEVTFLRGMILYRERKHREAELLLRQVANSRADRYEVAVASHLIGRIDGRRHQTWKQGERLLRKSLEIGRKIENPAHQAQVLHTLGKMIGRDGRRRAEAEELLRESLEIGREIHHYPHQAQVLHTLGQMIGRDGRPAEAEELLRESLEIEESLNRAFGRAQVLHTLGNLLGRHAERQEEAEKLLRESLEIGREINDPNHKAGTLYDLSQLKRTPPDVAEAMLRESLVLNLRIGNKRGERIVRDALRRLLDETSA